MSIVEDNNSLDVYKYTIDYYPELIVLKKTDSEDRVRQVVSHLKTLHK